MKRLDKLDKIESPDGSVPTMNINFDIAVQPGKIISTLKNISNFALNNENTVWFSLNSWIMPLQEKSFSGHMSLSDKNILTLDIYKFIPANPALKYDAIKIIKRLNS